MLYRDITPYKYQLAATIHFDTGIKGYSFIATYLGMTPSGTLIIREGYIWNGASGPTFDTMDSMKGSLIHDALYECMRRGLLPLTIREKADRILHDVCTSEGMLKKRADLWYDMVQKFAEGSARPGTEMKDKVLDTEVRNGNV
jgi:hypothetical protein